MRCWKVNHDDGFVEPFEIDESKCVIVSTKCGVITYYYRTVDEDDFQELIHAFETEEGATSEFIRCSFLEYKRLESTLNTIVSGMGRELKNIINGCKVLTREMTWEEIE